MAVGLRLVAALRAAGAACGASAACLVASLQAADSDHGLGPLRLSSQALWNSFALSLVPRPPPDLPAGGWELFLGSTWTNAWSLDAQYEIDYEMLQHELAVGYAPVAGWRLELGLLDRSTFGGSLDSFIEDFHELCDMSNHGRRLRPRDATTIRIAPTASQPGLRWGRAELDRQHEAAGRGSVQYLLWPSLDARPALGLGLTAQSRLESSDLADGGALDVAAELTAAWHAGPGHAYVGAATIRHGAEHIAGVRLRRWVWGAFAAVELHLAGRWSLLAQYLLNQGRVPDYRVFSRNTHELVLGAKARVGERLTAEIGVLENIFVYDSTPDVGFHAALRWRW